MFAIFKAIINWISHAPERLTLILDAADRLAFSTQLARRRWQTLRGNQQLDKQKRDARPGMKTVARQESTSAITRQAQRTSDRQRSATRAAGQAPEGAVDSPRLIHVGLKVGQ